MNYEDYLMHYGVGHLNGGHSGRYPWGSGVDPHQHSGDDDFVPLTPKEFYDKVTDITKKDGEKAAAEYFGVSVNRLRDFKTIAKADVLAEQYRKVEEYKEKGYSQTKACSLVGIPESTFRTWAKNDATSKLSRINSTANILENAVKDKKFIDVSKGVERQLGISEKDLSTAVEVLKTKGYVKQVVSIPQVGNPDQYTNVKVLAAPGTTAKEIFANRFDVKNIEKFSQDGGQTWFGIQYPESVDRSRVGIRYDEDGGTLKDGVIELRRGVKDLSMNGSQYAQVRIAVGDGLYLKGMAVYSDDLPKGIDIMVNSNKHRGTPDEKVFKKMKTINVQDSKGNIVETIDKDNPFGALIKEDGGQTFYKSKDGNYVLDGNQYVKIEKSTKVDPKADRYALSPVNKIKEEGDWERYQKTLSSQFLSKQPKELIDRQLKLSLDNKRSEFEEIKDLQNPVVKAKQLMDFADACDKAAVSLKAAALPGQNSKVLLPVNSLKPNEVYAPGYEDGTQLALIRYPHAGPFEIPVLKVNNKNSEASAMIKNAVDAIGIHPSTATQLSGADFDGDTAMVIPTKTRKGVNIASRPYFEGLKNFDTKDYKFTTEQFMAAGRNALRKQMKEGKTFTDDEILQAGKEKKVMSEIYKQKLMGIASNLITDMTLQGANEKELERAVKFSMVVIDAVKHELDYKACEKECNIKELQEIYQNDPSKSRAGGAFTIISKSKGEMKVPQRDKTRLSWNPETGEKIFYETGKNYTKADVKDPKTGKIKSVLWNKKAAEQYDVEDVVKFYNVDKLQNSTRMYETSDAMTLVSPARHPTELAYARYANALKSMANDARKAISDTVIEPRDPAAAKAYSTEVSQLKAALNTAMLNAPRERQAQIIANKRIAEKKAQYPYLTQKEYKEDLKKIERQAIAGARAEVQANGKNTKIQITDGQWKAIQARAVSPSMLEQVLRYADSDRILELSRPKEARNKFSLAQVSRMKSMDASGFTLAEIAKAMGVSSSTVSRYLKGEI